MASLQAHLSNLALAQGRLLTQVWVDGRPFGVDRAAALPEPTCLVEALTDSLESFASELTQMASAQAGAFALRVRQAAANMLINPWHAAERIWSSLSPDLRNPLVLVAFCLEMGEASLPFSPAGTERVYAHLRSFRAVWRHIEEGLASRDVEGFFDVLDLELAPWFEQLAKMLRASARPVSRLSP
jgi:hypothetical protein